MGYKTLVAPNYGHHEYAGNCLPMAQKVVGAPGGPVSAMDAGEASQFKHYDRDFPSDAPAVVWLSHWGTYTNYLTGQLQYGNWGHVVFWEPTAFDGAGGFFSSPRSGYGPGEWFRTIEEIERAFSSSYRFWSEDINGVRVIAPDAKHAAPAAEAWEDSMKHFGGVSTRTNPQTIAAGVRTRLAWSEAPTGGESIAGGPCDVVGLVATVRLKGKPGARVEFGAYKETGRQDPARVALPGPRATFDSLGVAQEQLMFSGPLAAADRIRLTVKTSPDAGDTRVESISWSGYAR